MSAKTSSLSRRGFLGGVGTTLAAGAVCGYAQSADPPGPRLADQLHEARFFETLDGNAVRCALCPRRCRVAEGRRGYCRVRENRGGRYYTHVYGRPAALNLDPIEKKPFFHVHPGSKAFSIGTVGCNLHCKFCQNWDISQASPETTPVPFRGPDEIADAAVKSGARTIAYTYNEPTVFYEYLADCARAGQARGLESLIVSNGFINDAPQRALFPLVKAIKIDLKAFTQAFYGDVCGGRLQPVLETLKRLSGSGVWYEIVMLLIPTLNDAPDDLKRMAAWIAKELGPDVPIHFTRYQPLYQLRNLPPTPAETIVRARETAMQAGCRFVYTGNVPGLEGQDTLCPSCRKPVVKRYGFSITENHIAGGKCQFCGTVIPGVWG